ncbi:MAG TPA: 30S ribosomal protein S2 [Anaerolineae bacterium]|nr:30S ribosomal protein S2 [Anaerolineae bacterium]HQH36912.1 30S ribosomal protein S2 [Anaerolineae bacterium]
MAVVTMKQLLETGVHFGHRTRRWDPRMARYIYTERNGVHIIDLQQTVRLLERAYAAVRDVVAEGRQVLFVGTKRQAQETIQQEATRCNMPYVNERWLGGTLTNWRTIRQRIEYLKTLEARRDAGEFDLLTKKEALLLNREIEKLNGRLGGLKNTEQLPGILFVIDVKNEATAIKEADRMGIPIVAVVDTNCNPEKVDYVIPANDDAIRAIRLLTAKIADAALEGLALRKEKAPEEEVYAEDEKYLSAETLARLRQIQFTDEDVEDTYEYEDEEADEEADDEEAELDYEDGKELR